MKLSTFDLNWYRQWAIEHTPLEEWSRPGLTNFLGSIQLTADPTSIRHIVFAPVSGAEESTAYLTLNGTLLAATLNSTTVRWTPWEFERESHHDGWKIHSRTAMTAGKPGIIQAVTICNDTPGTRTLKAGFRLSGRTVNRGLEPWYWGIPRVELTTDALHGHSGLNPIKTRIQNQGYLFQERPVSEAPAGSDLEHAGKAFNAQVLSPAPDAWQANGDALYEQEVPAGESFSFFLAIAVEESGEAAATALSILEDPAREFKEAEQTWRDLWHNAFTEGGPLSGKLEDLELPDSLAPVAVSSILSALTCRRTFPVAGLIPSYSISMPRRVEACFYPNDWALSGELLAEMDPEATWRQLGMALEADIRSNNQVNLLTGKGGDWKGNGWPYTIDVFNCFYTTLQLWEAGGSHVQELTERRLKAFEGKAFTVLEIFENLAFDWRSRSVKAYGLADYGPKEELLECVSTYEHVVAGLNAGAAWMLLRLAELYRLLGRDTDAKAVETEAHGIIRSILEHLYVKGGGYFRCLDRDGAATEVRTCWDFGMVGFCIGEHLPESVKEEMVRFFREELQTPGWLRALSPHDADAATSGFRADHQYNGAYGAWPAQCALALIKFGKQDIVRSWFEGIARTARQGPFAQAHYDEGVWPPTHEGATKVTEEVPQCIHWSNISGGLFWAAMRTLFAEQ